MLVSLMKRSIIKMSKYFLGVDPGKTGGIALLGGDTIAKAWRYGGDVASTTLLLQEALILANMKITMCILEKVHAMPKQGVTSVFTFGENYGAYQGMLASLNIPYVLVTPRTWQKEVMGVGKGDTKERSLTMARQMFPSVDLKYKKDDGMSDALLMAEYGRRLYS